jgi:hypothetical protein
MIKPAAPLPFLALLACTTDPGVLEGEADDEAADAASSVDTESGAVTDTETGAERQGGHDCIEHVSDMLGDGTFAEFDDDACPIVCGESWTETSVQLPIAWTTSLVNGDLDERHEPVGMIALDAGVVLGAWRANSRVELTWLDDAGQVEAHRVIAEHPASKVVIAGTSERVFLGIGGTIGDMGNHVSAFDADGVLLWTRTLEGLAVDPMNLAPRPDGGVFVTIPGSTNLLAAFAGDGTLEWSTSVDDPRGLALAPSGRIAVGGETLSYFTSLGQLEHVFAFVDSPLFAQRLAFDGDERLVGIGTLPVGAPMTSDGLLFVVEGLADQPVVERKYNRGHMTCMDRPTVDWFTGVTSLADGTIVIAAAEQGPLPDTFVTQPLVLHVDAQGNYLASDRGAWWGSTRALASDASGSVYAAMTVESESTNPFGFVVRKYQP